MAAMIASQTAVDAIYRTCCSRGRTRMTETPNARERARLPSSRPWGV